MNSSEEVQDGSSEKQDDTENLLERIYTSTSPNKVEESKRPLPVNREFGKIKVIENKSENKTMDVSAENEFHSKRKLPPVDRKAKQLVKTHKTVILGRPLTRLMSHSSSTIFKTIPYAEFNDSLSEAFQKIISTFDEKSAPQCNEDLLVLKTLERHLRCLQTIFIDKYESLSEQNKEREIKSYKFVALIENDRGKLVLKDSETKPMFDILPSFSVADFELKLKRCFTDMMSSFVERVKLYLNKTSQKDFEQMMVLFEAEQNAQCSHLLNWLDKKSNFITKNLNTIKLETLEKKFIEASESLKKTEKEHANELANVIKDAEIREANVLMETDTKVNKILIKMGELEKMKKNVEDKLKETVEKLDYERNIFQNMLNSEKKKHIEVIRAHEESIEAKTKNIEQALHKTSESLEQEKQKNLSLMLELYEIRSKEKEFQDINTDLTEKLNCDAQAQGDKIKNLHKKLNETEEVLQNLRNFNKDHYEEIRTDIKDCSSTMKSVDTTNEEIMILRKINVELKKKLELQRERSDWKVVDITNQLNETQEHESELKMQNLALEKKLEITESEKIAEMAQFAFKLRESQEFAQHLQCQNAKLKENLEKLRREKDGAKTRLLLNLKETQDRVNYMEKENIILSEHLRKEFENCKMSLDTLKISNAQLKEKSELYQNKYNAIFRFIGDLKEMRLSLKDVSQIHDDLVHNIKKLDDERYFTIGKLIEELSQIKESIQTLQDDNLKLRQNITIKEDENNDAMKQLVKTINEDSENITKLQKENSELKEQAGSKNEEMETINHALNESLDLVSELTEKLTSEKETNEKLQVELNESRTRARDLELVYAELSKKLEDDGQENSLAEEMLNDLIESRKTVKELEIANEELTRKIQIQENRSIGNYGLKFDRLKAERRDLRVSIDEHLEKLSSCNEAILTLKGVIAHKDETLELKTKHIVTLKREIRDLFHDLETLRGMVISKNKQICRLETKLSTSTEHFKNLFSTFGHKNAECFEIGEKCRVMRDAINRANKIRKNHEETIELLKRKMFQLTKTI